MRIPLRLGETLTLEGPYGPQDYIAVRRFPRLTVKETGEVVDLYVLQPSEDRLESTAKVIGLIKNEQVT